MSLRKTKSSKFNVPIPNSDGTGVASHVPITITQEWDDSIQEWFVTPESEELIESTKARHMGLLPPEDLRRLRARLNLTQREIGELLQIGEKSWTRWETGRQRPSRSMNILLRALADGLLDVEYLQYADTSKEPDWCEVIHYDFKREQVSMDVQIATRPVSDGYPQVEQLAKAE